MKRIMILIVLVSVLVVNCSYFEGAERTERERGVECRYNKRGGLEHCRFIN